MNIFKSISNTIAELSIKRDNNVVLEEAPKELDRIELHMKVADRMLAKALKAAAIATTVTII